MNEGAVLDLERINNAFTSQYHVWTFLTSKECPASLAELLQSKFSRPGDISVEERLRWGGIFLNGKDTREDVKLESPCRIEYYEPRYDFTQPLSYFPAFDPSWILYQDDYLLVSFKPSRLPTIPAREQTHFSLRNYLEAHLGMKIHMPSRIDMSTSGLVVVSKNELTHNKLQRLFETRTMEKYYLLQVSKEVDWQCREVTLQIGKDRRHPVLRTAVSEGGKAAHTRFTFIRRAAPLGEGLANTSILEAKPFTGRTHQIRVHAQSMGLPIVGDNFYGGAKAESLHLLSHRVIFRHPIGSKLVEVSLPEALRPAWAAGSSQSAL